MGELIMEQKLLLNLNLQFFATTEEKFYEVMSSDALKSLVENPDYVTEPYLGEALFPAEKVRGLKLSYIKDSRGLPMALKPSQFDTKAAIRDRLNVEVMQDQMPLFREGMILGEVERQELFEAFMLGREAYTTILRRIYDDRLTLLEGANVQAERLRMQLLATGKIEVTANGEYMSYDYNLPTNHIHTVATADEWTNPNADILGLFNLARKTIRKDTGKTLGTMIMTSDTMEKLFKNAQLAAIIEDLRILPSDEDFRLMLERSTKMRVRLYDKMFIDEEGKTQNLFPEGVVTFIPDGMLGRTAYGTTPEEFDLLNTTGHAAEVSIVNTGVAITSYKQVHPVNSKTIVSQITLPSFEQANNVFIANVYTP